MCTHTHTHTHHPCSTAAPPRCPVLQGGDRWGVREGIRRQRPAAGRGRAPALFARPQGSERHCGDAGLESGWGQLRVPGPRGGQQDGAGARPHRAVFELHTRAGENRLSARELRLPLPPPLCGVGVWQPRAHACGSPPAPDSVLLSISFYLHNLQRKRTRWPRLAPWAPRHVCPCLAAYWRPSAQTAGPIGR